MTVYEFLYKLEGEIEGTSPEDCHDEIEFVTSTGRKFRPTEVSGGGGVIIIDLEPIT